jgi:hypothetical protein
MSDETFNTAHAEKNSFSDACTSVRAEKNAYTTVEERRFQRRVSREKLWALAPVASPRMKSGISHARNDLSPICTNLQSHTAQTLPPHPPTRTPWNERPAPCI